MVDALPPAIIVLIGSGGFLVGRWVDRCFNKWLDVSEVDIFLFVCVELTFSLVCVCAGVSRLAFGVFEFWIIGLCVYAFLCRVCDLVTCSLCGWIAGSVAEFCCVSARCNCVGFVSACVPAAGLLVTKRISACMYCG